MVVAHFCLLTFTVSLEEMIDISILVLLGALAPSPAEPSLIPFLLEQMKIYGKDLIQTDLESILSIAIWVFFP